MAVNVGPYTFQYDPTGVTWDYSVKTSLRETIGGVVVQVFGTTIGDITLTGSFGQNGPDDLQAFVNTMQALMEQQMDKSQPLQFNYPSRGWSFPVFVKNVQSNKGGTVYRDPTTITYGYTLTLLPDTQDPHLISSATDHFLEHLMGDGLGWKQSVYNGPLTMEDVRANLANMQYHTIDEMAQAAQESLLKPPLPSEAVQTGG